VKEMRDRDANKRRRKRRRRNSGSGTGSNTGSASSSSASQSEDEDGDAGRTEPKLEGITPAYDLKLFQEAQAVASEKLVRSFSVGTD